jgi:hypothetical protein
MLRNCAQVWLGVVLCAVNETAYAFDVCNVHAIYQRYRLEARREKVCRYLSEPHLQ